MHLVINCFILQAQCEAGPILAENSLNTAILLHQSGRLAEVWELHQQILVELPGYADSANHFFGMLEY